MALDIGLANIDWMHLCTKYISIKTDMFVKNYRSVCVPSNTWEDEMKPTFYSKHDKVVDNVMQK